MSAIIKSAIAFARYHFTSRRSAIEQRIAEANAAIEELDNKRYVHWIARQRDLAELASLDREFNDLPAAFFREASERTS